LDFHRPFGKLRAILLDESLSKIGFVWLCFCIAGMLKLLPYSFVKERVKLIFYFLKIGFVWHIFVHFD
jgi:hypothetical protein